MKKNIIISILSLLLIFIIITGLVQPISGPFTNTLFKGWWIVSGSKICIERTWGHTGTLDTVVITGLDTTCNVFLQPKTTQIENLIYDIQSGGDTLFVTADSAGTADTDKYSILIIQNAYNASD